MQLEKGVHLHKKLPAHLVHLVDVVENEHGRIASPRVRDQLRNHLVVKAGPTTVYNKALAP